MPCRRAQTRLRTRLRRKTHDRQDARARVSRSTRNARRRGSGERGRSTARQEDGGASPAATVAPTPPFSATLVAQADLDRLPAGEARLSVVTYSLPPGTTTQPIIAEGPVLIRVQSGSVTVDADRATIDAVVVPVGLLQPVASTPGAASGQAVGAGQQILIPTGVTSQIGNSGAAAATIVVISISPEEAADGGAADEIPATPTS